MPLESATYVDDLVSTNPLGTDDASLGDDHIRLIKSVLKNTFPNLDGALTTKLSALNGVSQLITVGSDGETLTFTFPSGGTVGNVTDWTSNQPVPASQADGRYVLNKNPSYPSDTAITALSKTPATDAIWVIADDGKSTQLQPAGDYATNPALNTETTNRTNADTNLQNQIDNRVLKTGDAISWLQVLGATWTLGNQSAVWNGVVNKWSNSYVDNDGNATWDLNGGSPSNATGNINWLKLYTDGHLQTGKGVVAFQSQLPFIDQNLRVQVFSATVSDGGTVYWPTAFSGIPVLFLTNCYPAATRITTVQPTSLTNTSAVLQVQIVAGDHTQPANNVGTWFMVGGYF